MRSSANNGNVSAFMSSDGPSQNTIPLLRKSLVLLALSALAGCAGAPANQRYASREGGGIDPRYGVRASPRVVADGEEVPQGGGRYQVGKPYKIAGKTYYPSERAYAASGTASWYGSDFHGRKTANGEVFDRNSLSAAHPTMPLPSYARVTNLRNSHSIIVRVNDRGPYHGGRVMDVSQRVAEALDFRSAGTAQVKVEWIGRAELEGSDNTKLMASLRTDGAPAILPGMEPPVMTAEAPAPTRVAYAEPPHRPAELDTDRDVAPVAATRPTRSSAEQNAESLARTAPEEVSAREKPAPIDAENEEVDLTPIKSIHSAHPVATPLPPTRPADLGASSSKNSAKQAMN
jgi:rare lipoprotein A